MPYDEELADRLRAALSTTPRVSEKRMFGGTGFMVDGALACSVSARGLLVRVGAEQQGGLLAAEGVEPMVMRGRASRGWVHVSPEVVVATFFNFHPPLVRAALPAAWDIAPPAAIHGARLEAAGTALREILGDEVAGSEELAWAVGSWAVARAGDTGAVRVVVGDREWRRGMEESALEWRPAGEESVDPTTVTIHLT